MKMEKGFGAGISMNFVELMIGEKLKEADPALDLWGQTAKFCRWLVKTSLTTLNSIGI